MAATLLMQVGTPDLAMPHFQRAIELRPEGARDKINLALALATVPGPLRDPQAAIAWADEARVLVDFSDAGQVSSLVQIYAATGQFERAAQFAESAAEEFEESREDSVALNLRSVAEQIRTQLEQTAE